MRTSLPSSSVLWSAAAPVSTAAAGGDAITKTPRTTAIVITIAPFEAIAIAEDDAAYLPSLSPSLSPSRPLPDMPSALRFSTSAA